MIQHPQIPVINNVDVKAESGADAIRDALRRQLFMPVRWVDIITAMGVQGVENMVECGPGKVLVGLNKRINKGMGTFETHDPESLMKALETLTGE